MEGIQTLEVHVGSIHDIHSARLANQLVQDADVVDLAVRDPNEAGNPAAQLQQGMQLDGGPGTPERSPREQGQTQVEGRGVESEDGTGKVDSDGLADIQRP